MHHLKPKYFVRQFFYCVNIIQCSYTNLDDVAYCTHLGYMVYSLLLLGFKPLQYATVQNDTKVNQAQEASKDVINLKSIKRK